MTRLIKRYDNRKLYDTHAKAYVSLDDLAALIRRGHQIQVLENSSGDDITAQTLVKIIAEGRRPALPRELLHELVRWGGKVAAATSAEIEQRLDRLVAASLERLGVARIPQDLQQLRERIGRLEQLLAEVEAALEEPPGR